jgi:hypothetical protein
LNLLLIPKDIQILNLQHLPGLGAQGAAIAALASCVVGLLYVRLLSWKLMRVKGNPRILLHFLAAGVMAIVLYFINNIIIISRWYHLLGAAILGLGVYVCMLWLFREFTKEDLYFFLDILNMKKMYNYINKEIKEK